MRCYQWSDCHAAMVSYRKQPVSMSWLELFHMNILSVLLTSDYHEAIRLSE